MIITMNADAYWWLIKEGYAIYYQNNKEAYDLIFIIKRKNKIVGAIMATTSYSWILKGIPRKVAMPKNYKHNAPKYLCNIQSFKGRRIEVDKHKEIFTNGWILLMDRGKQDLDLWNDSLPDKGNPPVKFSLIKKMIYGKDLILLPKPNKYIKINHIIDAVFEVEDII